MDFVPVDNLPLLNAALEIQSVGNDLVQKLQENAHSDTQKNTVDAIRMVIETQSEMIKNLIDLQITLTDKIERIVAATQT